MEKFLQTGKLLIKMLKSRKFNTTLKLLNINEVLLEDKFYILVDEIEFVCV